MDVLNSVILASTSTPAIPIKTHTNSLLLFYIVPILIAVEFLIIYLGKLSDEHKLIIRKFNYLLAIIAYVITVNAIDLDSFGKDTKFGMPTWILALIVLFLVFCIAAYIIDLLLMSDKVFNEFSFLGFGAKFSTQETKETIQEFQKYIYSYEKSIQVENAMIADMSDYIVREMLIDKLNNSTFFYTQETAKIITKFYEQQNILVNTEVYKYKNNDPLDTTLDSIKNTYGLRFIQPILLEKEIKKMGSFFLKLKSNSLCIVTTQSKLSNDNNEYTIIVVSTKDQFTEQEPCFILNILVSFDSEMALGTTPSVTS